MKNMEGSSSGLIRKHTAHATIYCNQPTHSLQREKKPDRSLQNNM